MQLTEVTTSVTSYNSLMALGLARCHLKFLHLVPNMYVLVSDQILITHSLVGRIYIGQYLTSRDVMETAKIQIR